MQPATFDDAQMLPSTHYHVDACFWKGDTFIDGTTFLVPSKLPKVALECYTVDLDEVTGVHHVALRKMSLRTALSLTNSSNPQFSSHVVEFSNGEMIVVPRVSFAAPGSKLKAPMFGKDNEVEPVRDQVADNQPRLTGRSVSTSHVITSTGTDSAPAGLASSISGYAAVTGQVACDRTPHSASFRPLLREHFTTQIVATPRAPDNSIIESGRVVGQQAANDQSGLSNFSESIIHIVPRNATVSASINVEGSIAAAPVQEPVETTVDIETPTISRSSRRASDGSQGSGNPTSTVPTSPSSSTFSALPYWKSVLVNLPNFPIAPGKPSHIIEALALEESKEHDAEKTNDSDSVVVRRRSWDLRISNRQLIHWDEIQECSESPCLEYVPASESDLTVTEEGQIIIVRDTGNNGHSSLILPQLTSKPVEALNYRHVDETYVSERFDALDVVRMELVAPKPSRLSFLDLAPRAKGKERAMNAPKSQRFPPMHDADGVEIATNNAPGELCLRPKVPAQAITFQSILAVAGTNAATGASIAARREPSSVSVRRATGLGDVNLPAKIKHMPTETKNQLASWSSSPGRVLRGGCDQTYAVGPEPREKEQHPDYDWNSIDVKAGCVERFNLASTLERMIVDPDFDEYIVKLLGRGELAQEFRSGQGIVPRATSRMMTLLGTGAIEKIMNGCSIPRATSGMVTLLGNRAVPDIADARPAPRSPLSPVFMQNSSEILSGNTFSSLETIESEDVSSHTRNTSISNTSSSSGALSSVNWENHTRSSSISEPLTLDEEWNQERAMYDAVKSEGYAASWIARHESPTKAPAILKAAALENPLASTSVQHEKIDEVEEGADVLDEEEVEEIEEAEETVDGAENSVEGSREAALSLVLIHVLEQFAKEKLGGAQH